MGKQALMLNNAAVHCCRWIDPLVMKENRTVVHKASAEEVWGKQLATEELQELQGWFIDCVMKFPAEFKDDLANPQSLGDENYQVRFQMEGWRKLAASKFGPTFCTGSIWTPLHTPAHSFLRSSNV